MHMKLVMLLVPSELRSFIPIKNKHINTDPSLKSMHEVHPLGESCIPVRSQGLVGKVEAE